MMPQQANRPLMARPDTIRAALSAAEKAPARYRKAREHNFTAKDLNEINDRCKAKLKELLDSGPAE